MPEPRIIQPKYKGSLGPFDESTHRRWSEAGGWETYVTYRGHPRAIVGLLPSLQEYCSEIELEQQGPYWKLIAHYGSYLPDQKEPPSEIWEIGTGEGTKNILTSTYAFNLEAASPGALAIVQIAVNEFNSNGDQQAFPAALASILSAIPDQTNRNKATEIYNRIVRRDDDIRYFVPSVSRTFIINSDWNYNRPQTTVEPTIYESTAALARTLGTMPDITIAQLAEGQWMENPPTLRQTSYNKFESRQHWDWAKLWDPLKYPVRIK